MKFTILFLKFEKIIITNLLKISPSRQTNNAYYWKYPELFAYQGFQGCTFWGDEQGLWRTIETRSCGFAFIMKIFPVGADWTGLIRFKVTYPGGQSEWNEAISFRRSDSPAYSHGFVLNIINIFDWI